MAMKCRTKLTMHKVKKAADTATFKAVGQAAAYVYTVAKNAIKKRARGKASPAGSPPFTHTNRLKRAIKFYADGKRGYAIIGTDVAAFGKAGAAFERETAGEFRGAVYPPRPFMRPALEKARPRLPKHWQNSIR